MYQWLFFQASGQGPYFGQVRRSRPFSPPSPSYHFSDASIITSSFLQAAHFKIFAPEKIPYAINRYAEETKRVLGVLEAVLSKADGGYLVGGKLTIADLSFITWFVLPRSALLATKADSSLVVMRRNNFGLNALLPEGVDTKKEFPSVVAWHEKLLALPYVAEALAEKAKLS